MSTPVGLGEHGVTRPRDHRVVNTLIETEVVGALARPETVLHTFLHASQVGELIVRDAFRGKLRSHSLQLAGNLEQLHHLARRHRPHPCTAVREQFHEPLEGENLQGFTQGRPRNLQEIAKPLLVDALAQRELVLDDHVTQMLGHVRMKRAPPDGRLHLLVTRQAQRNAASTLLPVVLKGAHLKTDHVG